MAAFTFNRYSGTSYDDQYYQYLQNQSYTNQVSTSINDVSKRNAEISAIQTKEMQKAIKASSDEQREAMMAASNIICKTLDRGFSQLTDSLNDLSDLVGHGFSMLCEEQKLTNQYLGQIQNLLRIPDSQKQRAYHIEEGMKYLKNAIDQSVESDFYVDALEEFQKAESIERKDFFSLYYIGFIYLKSIKHLDIQKAENCFRTSAKYYLAEAVVGGTNTSKNLIDSKEGFTHEATDAYLFAAEACYIQEKYSEAAALAANAWKILPDLNKAGFFHAKYLSANNQVEEAIVVLEKVIEADRFLTMEVIADLDLVSKPLVLDLLERLRLDAYNEAKSKYDLCIKSINNVLTNSVAGIYLSNIRYLLDDKTFLDAKEANDLLIEEKEWFIDCGADVDSDGKVLASVSAQSFRGSVIDFVEFERERVLALPLARKLISIRESEEEKEKLLNSIEAKKISREKIPGNVILIFGVVFFGVGGISLIMKDSDSMGSGLLCVCMSFLSIYAIMVVRPNKISSLEADISSIEQTIKELDIKIDTLRISDGSIK